MTAGAPSTRRAIRPGSVRHMMRNPVVVVSLVVLTWFTIAFLLAPNLGLLRDTFLPDGQLSLRAFERLSSSDRAMRSLTNSFLLAVALALATNVVGVFVVLATRFFDLKGGRILTLGYSTSLIYGGIVLAAGYKLVYGAGGPIGGWVTRTVPGLGEDWFEGFWAVLFTMTLATTTNHLLFVSSAIRGIDNQMIEAARMMGAGTGRILARIVLPSLIPVLFAVTVLSFLTGLGALSAPQVLGGTEFQTIAPMILTFSGSVGSRDLAALLAIILGIASMLLLAVLTRIERSGVYFSIAKVASPLQKQKIRNPVANVLVHIAAWGLWVLYMLPVVLIVLLSFADPDDIARGVIDPAGLTLENYARVLGQESALGPLIVSIVYSAIAALVVGLGILVVSWIITRWPNPLSTLIEYVLHIPWILPSTMIALGLLLTYDRPQWLAGGSVLSGTVTILGIAYVIVKIPFTLRLLKAAFAALDPRLEEAAALMGAGSLTTIRRVLLPAVLPVFLAVTALNFNSLLDDYDTAVFLHHPVYQPLGIAIRAATTGFVGPEARATTFVYTVILMLVTGLTMYLVYGRTMGERRPRRGRRGRRRPALSADDIR